MMDSNTQTEFKMISVDRFSTVGVRKMAHFKGSYNTACSKLEFGAN